MATDAQTSAKRDLASYARKLHASEALQCIVTDRSDTEVNCIVCWKISLGDLQCRDKHWQRPISPQDGIPWGDFFLIKLLHIRKAKQSNTNYLNWVKAELQEKKDMIIFRIDK